MKSRITSVVVASLAMMCLPVLGSVGSARANPTFNLSYISGTSLAEQTAFASAASYWSSSFRDNVTINLTVGTGTLGSGVLAQASSIRTTVSYGSFRSQMVADATSATDAAAVAHLPNTTGVSMLLNYTSNNPNGSGSATPYVDSGSDVITANNANNTTVRLTNANARALGYNPATSNLFGLCPVACDGFIQFAASGFTWDLDRTNGITVGAFDFVGLAIHEIGHALGFVSGVDVLDTASSAPSEASLTQVTPLDMFRCSSASAGASTTLDFTAGTAVKNFSLNNCATTLGQFATGFTLGDGRQASHWKDSLGLGIMDPTAAPGELLAVTPLDLLAFDAIGWDLAVPEPGTMVIGATWMLGLLAVRRRSQANRKPLAGA
jgi:hypothetical protein